MMKRTWFKRLGWVYWPVSWQGSGIVLAGMAFCIQVFAAVDRHSHSASATLYGVFPYFACCFLLFNWVGSNTSRNPVMKDKIHEH